MVSEYTQNNYLSPRKVVNFSRSYKRTYVFLAHIINLTLERKRVYFFFYFQIMKMYSVLLGLVGLYLVSVVRSQEPTAAMDMEGRKNSMFFSYISCLHFLKCTLFLCTILINFSSTFFIKTKSEWLRIF